jgi:hypothetical protein
MSFLLLQRQLDRHQEARAAHLDGLVSALDAAAHARTVVAAPNAGPVAAASADEFGTNAGAVVGRRTAADATFASVALSENVARKVAQARRRQDRSQNIVDNQRRFLHTQGATAHLRGEVEAAQRVAAQLMHGDRKVRVPSVRAGKAPAVSPHAKSAIVPVDREQMRTAEGRAQAKKQIAAANVEFKQREKRMKTARREAVQARAVTPAPLAKSNMSAAHRQAREARHPPKKAAAGGKKGGNKKGGKK